MLRGKVKRIRGEKGFGGPGRRGGPHFLYNSATRELDGTIRTGITGKLEGHYRNRKTSRGKEICQHMWDRDGLQNTLLGGPEIHKRMQVGWSWSTGHGLLGCWQAWASLQEKASWVAEIFWRVSTTWTLPMLICWQLCQKKKKNPKNRKRSPLLGHRLAAL